MRSWIFVACTLPRIASIHLHENSLTPNSVPEMQKESSKWSLRPPFEIVSQWCCAYLSGTVFLFGQPPTDSELTSLCLALTGHCMSITSQQFSESPNRSNSEEDAANLFSSPTCARTLSLSPFITKVKIFNQCVVQLDGNPEQKTAT